MLTKLCGFQRRFEQASAALLASLDSSTIKAFEKDGVHHEPLHAEVPFGKYGVQQSDGSLALALSFHSSNMHEKDRMHFRGIRVMLHR